MVVRCHNPSTLEVEVGEPREFKAGAGEIAHW